MTSSSIVCQSTVLLTSLANNSPIQVVVSSAGITEYKCTVPGQVCAISRSASSVVVTSQARMSHTAFGARLFLALSHHAL